MSTIRIFKGGVSSFVLLLISAFLVCSNALAADFWPRFKYKSVVRWSYAGGTLPQVLRRPANMSIEAAIDTAITRAMRTMQDAVRDTYGSGITIQKATGLEYDIQIGWEDYPPCTDPSYLGTASTDTGGVTFARIFINNQLNWTILGTDPADGCTNYYDLQTTLLHEIGHTFLGVGNEFHADDPTYVMYGPYVGRKQVFNGGKRTRSKNSTTERSLSEPILEDQFSSNPERQKTLNSALRPVPHRIRHCRRDG